MRLLAHLELSDGSTVMTLTPVRHVSARASALHSGGIVAAPDLTDKRAQEVRIGPSEQDAESIESADPKFWY
jgi:hypothetical protein